MDQTNETRLGSAPLGKLLFQLGLPGVAAQVINVLYNIVDRIYIGNIPGIGDMALTGVGVTLPGHHGDCRFQRLCRHGRRCRWPPSAGREGS